jgi:hypothetical protein
MREMRVKSLALANVCAKIPVHNISDRRTDEEMKAFMYMYTKNHQRGRKTQTRPTPREESTEELAQSMNCIQCAVCGGQRAVMVLLNLSLASITQHTRGSGAGHERVDSSLHDTFLY